MACPQTGHFEMPSFFANRCQRLIFGYLTILDWFEELRTIGKKPGILSPRKYVTGRRPMP
jgi:hypothetical protein